MSWKAAYCSFPDVIHISEKISICCKQLTYAQHICCLNIVHYDRFGDNNFKNAKKNDYLNRPMMYLLRITYDSLHYENTPMQYTAIFHGCKNDNCQMKIFDIFLIFCSKHRLWVLTSTHNLCFGAKIRKKCIPL